MSDALQLLEDLIAKARAAGADAADAVAFESASLAVSLRFGKTEKLERSESRDLGLRVFVGTRQAIVSSTDRDAEALDALVERAVAMARVVPEDAYAGLADSDLLATKRPDLDIVDRDDDPSPETLMEQARIAEEAALAVPGITNSEGADAAWSRTHMALAASNGFSGAYSVSRRSLSAAVLAGAGTAMERDYDYDTKVYAADLSSPEDIGRKAAERTVRRLNPRKAKSCRVPVVFEERAARSLLSHLISAISGPSVARGTSFLKDMMGKRVFPESVTIVDDPFIRRGLRSRPFDGEGVAVERRTLVDKGVLTSWLLDLRSARQLGLTTTGHASRGASGPPSPAPANMYLAAGERSRDAIIGEIEEGFYVTELMGFGVNGVTGDYSRGATGFWIEKGKIVYPVSEMTIAGNLKDMYRNLEAADDLELRFGLDTPTLRVDGMTVAGM